MNPLPLNTIQVLWRQPRLMALWGIPYPMREGQEPHHLWAATGHVPADWIWLGQPGWWGSLVHGSPEREAVETFLASLPPDAIPARPGEWTKLEGWGR